MATNNFVFGSNVVVSHLVTIGRVAHSFDSKSIEFGYPCSDGAICSPYTVTLPIGGYILEVWGAEGGLSASVSGIPGLGGYAKGVFISKATTTLYLHIGGRSHGNMLKKGGYNGGGNGNNVADGSGGGASDFRTMDGVWNSSFESRIIVAGGGGGAFGNFAGGNGGGFNGESVPNGENIPCYGTQRSCEGGVNTHGNGTLGCGASRGYAGGGGGYYGGGNGINTGGGGGSSYIGKVTSYKQHKRSTQPGVNSGYGKAKITQIFSGQLDVCSFQSSELSSFNGLLVNILLLNLK